MQASGENPDVASLIRRTLATSGSRNKPKSEQQAR
jgi:hypothetical protein